ncbi:MAG: hypothetical protein ACFE8C_07245 [Promethearchaeota archaeon]
MAELTQFDIINGLLTIIFVSIAITLGFILISKYFKHKQRALFFMGATMIMLTSVWFTHSLAFILVLTTGVGLSPFMFFLFSFTLTPLALILWLMVFTDLVCKKKQKLIISIYVIYGVIFEVILIIFLFTNTLLVGELEGPLEAHMSPFILLHLLIILSTSFITGTLFCIQARRSEKSKIRLKGNLYWFGNTIFVIASILDSFSSNLLVLLIARLMLIISALATFWAFTLPNYIKKIFIREQ